MTSYELYGASDHWQLKCFFKCLIKSPELHITGPLRWPVLSDDRCIPLAKKLVMRKTFPLSSWAFRVCPRLRSRHHWYLAISCNVYVIGSSDHKQLKVSNSSYCSNHAIKPSLRCGEPIPKTNAQKRVEPSLYIFGLRRPEWYKHQDDFRVLSAVKFSHADVIKQELP